MKMTLRWRWKLVTAAQRMMIEQLSGLSNTNFGISIKQLLLHPQQGLIRLSPACSNAGWFDATRPITSYPDPHSL